jgi:hypothetical protein
MQYRHEAVENKTTPSQYNDSIFDSLLSTHVYLQYNGEDVGITFTILDNSECSEAWQCTSTITVM